MMEDWGKVGVAIQFIVVIGFVVVCSFLSVRLWGAKPEEIPGEREWTFSEGMTVAEFGQRNSVPGPVLKDALHLETKEDLQKGIGEFDLSRAEMATRIDKALALNAEHESKNWVKILVKFAFWMTFLVIVFVLMRKRRVTPTVRRLLYLAAVALFGVILGSDPSPMGTVKDAIVLFGARGVVFPPRMVALAVFLAMVVLANKFICSWGCQLGTLQDLLFRVNRDSGDRRGIMRQYKIPFVVTNGIRVLFAGILTLAAFLWATDIIEPIDPFKVYKPQAVEIAGGIFIGAALIASLFVYRPWCSLFCPFGLVGWFFEKFSLFKITVDYDTCTACESCARACPSPVMEAILKQDQVIPDCFACGTCIDVCPTKSISFASGKRTPPPLSKFGGDK